MKLKAFFFIVLLALCWGPSYLFIKIGIEDFSPITLVTIRLTLASLLCYGMLRMRKTSLPRSPRVWGHLAVQGFISCAMPFTLFGYGEMVIDSALAAIINGITPISAVICTRFMLANEPVTRGQVVGIFVGLTGFLVLLLPSLIDREIMANLWGIALVGIACLSYGLGMAYTRKYLKDLPPLVGPTAQLMTCCVYLIPLSIFVDRPWEHAAPSLEGIGAVTFLAVFGASAAFLLYFHILKISGPIALSTVTYLMPLVGVTLGVVVRDEVLDPTAYITLGLILVSIALTNKMVAFRLPWAKRTTPQSIPIKIDD